MRRWDPTVNALLVERVRAIANERLATPREVIMAWLLCHEFPVIAIVGMPSFSGAHGDAFARASELILDARELKALTEARHAAGGNDG